MENGEWRKTPFPNFHSSFTVLRSSPEAHYALCTMQFLIGVAIVLNKLDNYNFCPYIVLQANKRRTHCLSKLWAELNSDYGFISIFSVDPSLYFTTLTLLTGMLCITPFRTTPSTIPHSGRVRYWIYVFFATLTIYNLKQSSHSQLWVFLLWLTYIKNY